MGPYPNGQLGSALWGPPARILEAGRFAQLLREPLAFGGGLSLDLTGSLLLLTFVYGSSANSRLQFRAIFIY